MLIAVRGIFTRQFWCWHWISTFRDCCSNRKFQQTFDGGSTHSKVKKVKCTGICVMSHFQSSKCSVNKTFQKKCRVQHEASSLHKQKFFLASRWATSHHYSNLFCAPECCISELRKRRERGSPTDEAVKYLIVSRFPMVWTHHNLIFSICKRNHPLLSSCEDRKSLIWQRSTAICLGWAREQNTGAWVFAQTLYLAEMRAAENEGEGPSHGKIRALQSLPMQSHGFSRKETWEHEHTACERPSKPGRSRVRLPATHPNT